MSRISWSYQGLGFAVLLDSNLVYHVKVFSTVEKFEYKENFIEQSYKKKLSKRQLLVLTEPLKDLGPMAEAFPSRQMKPWIKMMPILLMKS